MEWSYTGSNREDLDWNPQSNRRRRQPRCAWWGMVEEEALQHGKTWSWVKLLTGNLVHCSCFVEVLGGGGGGGEEEEEEDDDDDDDNNGNYGDNGEQVCWKHPEWCWNQDWLICHDSVPLVHTALSVQKFLATKSMAVFSKPPYLICHLVILSWFCVWNCSYEDIVSRMSRKFWNSHWLIYAQYQKLNSISGRNAGPIA